MVRFDRNLEVKRLVPPVDVVMELNRRFLSQEVGYFTMIYGILDVETHEIRLCQAGHPSPLQVRADGTITPIGDGGFPVGLWPEMTYEETTAKLLPGERLVLYSDGLLGCIDPEGVAYSLSRLEQLLIDTASLPVKDVLQAIQVDLEAWTHGHTLADDISVLIIESK
jgi:sigma-B regulation protein RsbU (phosphoserine phosphatase)